MLEAQLEGPLAQTTFASMQADQCLPLDPEKPGEGGLFKTTSGLFLFFRKQDKERGVSSFLWMHALESVEEYPALLYRYYHFAKGYLLRAAEAEIVAEVQDNA